MSGESVEREAVSGFGIVRSDRTCLFPERWRQRTLKTRLAIALRSGYGYVTGRPRPDNGNSGLKGAFLFSKYEIPHMRGRGGAIVIISSMQAFLAYESYAGYAASKAGLLALTRSLALDHGRDRIRLNAMCPGCIDTPMTQAWLRVQPDPEAAMRQVVSAQPLGRIGTPRDVADAALFLASDAASLISGTYLVVDGAMSTVGH